MAEQVVASVEVPLERLEAQIGAALRAGRTLGKDVLRHQKRSAERSGATPGLLWLEDRYGREVAAASARLRAAEPPDRNDADYPDVIVIDDEDFAVHEYTSAFVIAD